MQRIRGGSTAAAIYDVLTTHDRWMTVDNIIDWAPDSLSPSAIRQALYRLDGDLWDSRPSQDSDGSNGGTVANEYRAVPDQWHRITEPTPTSSRRTRVNVPTPNPDETWEQYAARVVGADGNQPCTKCDGTGTVKAKVTKKAAMQAVKGNTNISVSQPQFAAWCANPRLDELRDLAERIDTDLDGAARFLTRVAELIEDGA